MEFIVAALAAAATVWSVRHTWFPVISRAIAQLPAEGKIRLQNLDWHGESPMRLADNQWLALSVDLVHAGEARSPSHLQIEFGRNDVRIISIFGFFPWNYPPGWQVAFNRTELSPWWGAWAPAILAIGAATVAIGLLVTWAILASLYSPVALLMAFFANRDLRLGQSWRLSSAALMPGALFLTLVIVLYGMGSLDLVRSLVAAGLHIVIGWSYLIAAVRNLPRLSGETAPATNPFATPPKRN